MVRFSCFNTNIHYHRSKKVAQQSVEAMSKASEDYSRDQGLKVSGVSNSIALIPLKKKYDNPSNTSVGQDNGDHVDHCLKPGEMCSDSSSEANIVVHAKTCLKKSKSLGSALDRGRISDGIDSEDEIDRGSSCDHVYLKDYAGHSDKAYSPESFQENNKVMPNESIFSIEDTKQREEDGGSVGDSGHFTSGSVQAIAKSCSSPNIDILSPISKDGSLSHAYVVHRCRSSEDLSALNEKREAIQNRSREFHAMEDLERDDDVLGNTNEDRSGEEYGYESYNYPFGKDWTMSRMEEVDMVKELEGESSAQNLNALPSKDFKIKRIEEWVSMIDLEASRALQDMSESAPSIDRAKKGTYVLGTSTAKLDVKGIHGIEAAKNYVSSLPATSTSAQLANLGLVAIPFLSAFVNLKTLNLSGNAIVRITSGALPRGLHALNLAKNNLSTIEGLRDLTRLRMLDLSYNRILRIGHGLASCSSLKELYLAGNKISEVEGLHRLLKLNVLDLRFNKISTAKCLGQLAANYGSLHAINLEGNPAQRNVGDEQLKKYLQSILPQLVYFNKQSIRASSSKEAADRSARSAIQLDRGLRSEHKLSRKGNHNLPTSKAGSSSSQNYRAQAVSSMKQTKGDRHGRLPPSGTKVSHRQHYLDLGSKLLGLRSDLSMRRSRSEGNLGAV